MAVGMTLAEKVWTIIATEEYDVGKGAELPGVELHRGLGQFENDICDWSMVYGIALGLARTEEPFEPLKSVVERAQAAAQEAYKRWSGDIAPPVDCINPLVQEILTAWHRDGSVMRDAIIDLGNTIGWPREKTEAMA